MKSENLVLDNTSTTGKVQFLVVKFSIAPLSVQLSIQRTIKHEKPKNNTKSTNHFTGLEPNTVVEIHLKT